MLNMTKYVLLLTMLTATASLLADTPFTATILTLKGAVDYSTNSRIWHQAAAGQQVGENTRLRTGDDSQAAIKLPSGAILRVGELSLVDLVPPTNPQSSVALSVLEGLFYFFSRSTPETVEILTPSATGAIRGTEFNLTVSRQGQATYAMVEGDVDIKNNTGRLALRAGDVGVIGAHVAPEKRALSQDFSELNGWLYYPAVLTPSDLSMDDVDLRILRASLLAYSSGDIKQALQGYQQSVYQQNDLQPLSDDAVLYVASLKLMVGRVQEAKSMLAARPQTNLSNALNILIEAITFSVHSSLRENTENENLINENSLNTASEWLAYSYYQQSQGELGAALVAVEKSLKLDSEFYLSWARQAELYFSHGRIQAAKSSLKRSFDISASNPLALSLQGFIDAADANAGASRRSFQQALISDAYFANGWLGDGLVSFSQGKPEAGLEALKLAAVMAPKRSLLRSYLGKGLAENEQYSQAEIELELAQKLDDRDPTPLFYQSLLDKKRNRFSESARAMYKAIELNDNRNIYRSRLLLDQDLAVRNTNLAAVYERLGMATRAVRSASRALQDDYSNYAAHQFVAESMTRDRSTDLLRTEAAITNELLLANLLSPVQAGTLSQFVSNREYSSFFSGKRYGANISAYLDEHHESVTEIDAFAIGGRSSVGLDVSLGAKLNFFESDNVDTDFDTDLLSLKAKHQLSGKGSLFFEFSDYGIDVDSRFFDGAIDGEIKTVSHSASLGYRHHWAPGEDTLLLLGVYEADTDFDIPAFPFVFVRGDSGEIVDGTSLPFLHRGSSTEKLTALEISHIMQSNDNRWISGLRLQRGEVDQDERLDHLLDETRLFFSDPVSSARFSERLERASVYSYFDVKIHPSATFTAGLAYDWLVAPAHIDSPPSAKGTQRKQQFSPKLGVSWQLHPKVLFRAAHTRSLGGFGIDQGVRLEPSQVAGFIQTFRSLIATAPDVFAAKFETEGVGLQYSPSADLFVDIELQQMQQDGQELLGGFAIEPFSSMAVPSALIHSLDYGERSLSLQVNWLFQRHWSTGAQYGFRRSELSGHLPDVGTSVTDPLLSGLRSDFTRADLQLVKLFVGFNHSTGLFAELVSTRYWPDDSGFYALSEQKPFSVSDVKLGYRSLGQRWQIDLQVENIENETPHINDLVPTREIQGQRTARLSINLNL